MADLECRVIAKRDILSPGVDDDFRKVKIFLVRNPMLQASGDFRSGRYDILIVDESLHLDKRTVGRFTAEGHHYGLSRKVARYLFQSIGDEEGYWRLREVIRGYSINPVEEIYQTPIERLARLQQEVAVLTPVLEPAYQN